MNHSFPNFCLNLGDSEDYPNTQYYQNSSFFPNASEVLVTEDLQTSQNTENHSRGASKWDVAEDVALMSAWCITSENSIVGKNRKISNLWAQVKKMYDTAQAENPEKLSVRNEAQMKGRFKRLSENGQKWVAAYREAYRQRKSGMNQKDIESEAHKLYEQDKRSKLTDYVVFNEVMCKHQKWALQLDQDTSRPRPEEGNEESGGSSKRSRTTEEGEYCANPNPETPTSGELRAMRLTRDGEIELMKQRLEFEREREQSMHLNTLLQKQFLTPEEENIKRHLMLKFYGSI
ncbi:hypothetical protein E3N88_18834 [Mikania micrantha]|uniref:No apical meristem-associated C-terminal domain-containing protein n=1 Tax=Mikania micrantha TaxID=192012 RepID=A0A5N6NP80_9ASTR|nr:hypothetical protein E3N88_18834 [Mikania micrantha]